MLPHSSAVKEGEKPFRLGVFADTRVFDFFISCRQLAFERKGEGNAHTANSMGRINIPWHQISSGRLFFYLIYLKKSCCDCIQMKDSCFIFVCFDGSLQEQMDVEASPSSESESLVDEASFNRANSTTTSSALTSATETDSEVDSTDTEELEDELLIEDGVMLEVMSFHEIASVTRHATLPPLDTTAVSERKMDSTDQRLAGVELSIDDTNCIGLLSCVAIQSTPKSSYPVEAGDFYIPQVVHIALDKKKFRFSGRLVRDYSSIILPQKTSHLKLRNRRPSLIAHRFHKGEVAEENGKARRKMNQNSDFHRLKKLVRSRKCEKN